MSPHSASLSPDLNDPRLIVLSAYGGPYDGSFVPMVRALLEGVERSGWSATAVFSPVASGRPWFNRINADFDVRLGPAGHRRATGKWIAGMLAEGGQGPALLHTHFTRYDLPALAAARRHGSTAVVWHVHTPLYPAAAATAQNAVKYGVLGRRVQGIFAPGPGPIASLERVGVPSARLQIVGTGIETWNFPPTTPEDRGQARDDLGVAPEATVLLHFGWDWFLKGGDLLLETVRALEGKVRGKRLTVLTVSEDPAAERAIAKAGLAETVRVIPPRDDVGSLYAAADAFVSTSRMEGGAPPFAVIEAVLSGLPVVATNLPGTVEGCRDLESCLVVEPSPGAMADAAVLLLSRPPEDAASAGARARARVTERFDLGIWSKRMVERYSEVLDSVR